jgi:hypothetical protein
LKLLPQAEEANAFGCLILELYFLNELKLELADGGQVAHIILEILIWQLSNFQTLDDLHRGDLLLLHLLVLIILLIVHWVIDASDGHPIVNSRGVDTSGQRVLRHRQICSCDQSLRGIVILLASVTEELPNLLRARGTSLPKLYTPLV